MAGETTRKPSADTKPGLITKAPSHVTGLVRKELDLARAEVQENVSKVRMGILDRRRCPRDHRHHHGRDG